MKLKLITFFISLIIPLSMVSAQDIAVKVSGGMINAPSIDEEIVLNEDDPATDFLEYEGEDGITYSLSIIIKYAEFGYKIVNYRAKKDKDGEKGDITFDTQTAYAAIYLSNPASYAGLNLSIGAGSGITKLTVNKEVIGQPGKIEDGLAYAKETHYYAGIHYGMDDTYGFSIKYTGQSNQTVKGKSFTNTFVDLTVDFLF